MKKFFLLIFTVIIIVIILSYFIDFNSSHIKEIRICHQIENHQCPNDEPVFDSQSPEIFLSCKLGNPIPETNIEFAWYYTTNIRNKIEVVILNSDDYIETLQIHTSLSRPEKGWPLGDYEVIITILNTKKEPIIKKFYVR